MIIFLKTKSTNVDAVAEFDKDTGKVVIKKGSIVAKDLSNAPTFRSRNSMLKKREGTVVDGVLQKDLEFSSLSTAATFAVGSNRDGWITWKDGEGNTMAELLQR